MISEPLLYHDASEQGFFFIMAGGRHKSYALSDIESVLKDLPSGGAPIFISQGDFYGRSRQSRFLARLKLHFADLDTHNTALFEQSPETQAWIFIDFCEQNGFPRPSLVNYSGRGLHAK